MRILFWIGAGGFIGSILRYLASLVIQNKFLSTYPYGTLGVNLLGCFAIGILFALSERGTLSLETRMFLVTGLCGGFTTFSAFSSETISMLREGQYLFAGSYISASVVLGLLATFLGIALIKLF